MEEKKSLKVSLKTYLISMFLMLLVIGILLGYIMHTSKTIHAKLTSIEKHIESQANIESVVEDNEEIENTVTEETVEETKESIKDVADEDDSEEDTNKKDSKTENTVKENITEDNREVEFSEEEIEPVLEGYLNIFKGHGSPAGILNSLDLMSFQESQNYELGEDNYRLTDIPYSVFEEKLEEYTTLENFKTINEGNKFVDLEFKNVDGYVAYFDGGWSGTEYEVYKIEKSENSLTATHTAEILRTEGNKKVIENVEFSVENNDGRCVISYCN